MPGIRKLRPRATAALAVTPVTVTDLTCAAVLGLESRPYRALLVRLDIPHVTFGQRTIASVTDVLSAIERASIADDPSEHDATPTDEPRDVDAVLARLGRRRMAG